MSNSRFSVRPASSGTKVCVEAQKMKIMKGKGKGKRGFV